MAMVTKSWLKGIFRKRQVNEAKAKSSETDEKVSIQPKIVWEYDLDGTWTAYPDNIQLTLEESHRSKAKVSLYILGKMYDGEIDFNANPIKQRNTKTRNEREVRRRVDYSFVPAVYHPPPEVWEKVPSTWIEHENGEDFMMVKVTQDSEDWKMVEKKLKSSLSKAKLHELIRVQNLHLWEYYMFRNCLIRAQMSLVFGMDLKA